MLKILAQGIKNSHIFGFQPLFIQMNHQWVWWEEIHTSAFTVWDKLQPNLFIGVGQPSKSTQKCLKEFNTPTIIQTSPFTYKIKEKIFKYDCLIDHFTYNEDKIDKRLSCDIGCNTINKTPNPYLINLCYPIRKYQIIILGDNRWNLPQYLGKCNIEEKVSLYRSSELIFCETEEEKARTIACGSISIKPSKILNFNEYNEYTNTILKDKYQNKNLKIEQKDWYINTVKTYKQILPELLNELNI